MSYDFEIDSIQDLRDFIELNKDLRLKKDRNVLYFAVPEWTLEGTKAALQMIQNRPVWNWDQVRAQITTYFWYHQSEAHVVRTALMNTSGDRPVVICRLINLKGSLAQIEKKFRQC